MSGRWRFPPFSLYFDKGAYRYESISACVPEGMKVFTSAPTFPAYKSRYSSKDAGGCSRAPRRSSMLAFLSSAAVMRCVSFRRKSCRQCGACSCANPVSVGHNALHFSRKRAFAFPFAKKQPYRQRRHSGKTLALLATEHVYARRLVGAVGLEPTRPKSEDFKSPAYANSATLPRMDHRASSAVPNNSKKHPRARLTHETYPIVMANCPCPIPCRIFLARCGPFAMRRDDE